MLILGKVPTLCTGQDVRHSGARRLRAAERNSPECSKDINIHLDSQNTKPYVNVKEITSQFTYD